MRNNGTSELKPLTCRAHEEKHDISTFDARTRLVKKSGSEMVRSFRRWMPTCPSLSGAFWNSEMKALRSQAFWTILVLALCSQVEAAAYDCNDLPGPTNSGGQRGCPGAIWSSGAGSKSYCQNTDGRFPWYAACCAWDSSTSTCKPEEAAPSDCRMFETDLSAKACPVCAMEGGNCECNGAVWYGAEGQFVGPVFLDDFTTNGEIGCSNNDFKQFPGAPDSGDPIPGTRKKCYCTETTSDICAGESRTCGCKGWVTLG